MAKKKYRQHVKPIKEYRPRAPKDSPKEPESITEKPEFFGSEEKEKRRIFTPEEKKAALAATGGICARCGTKLTLKTATMEHIIPLSRGGKNDPENLTVLCGTCNKDKGNLLYLPKSFYTALAGKPKLRSMEKMVTEWFREQKDKFDLENYPLIAPKDAVLLKARGKDWFLRNLIMEWSYVPEKNIDALSKQAGIDIKHYRYNTQIFTKGVANADIPEWKIKVNTYAMHRVVTGDLKAIAFVCYMESCNILITRVISCSLPRPWYQQILSQLTAEAIYAVHIIAEKDLRRWIAIAPEEDMLEGFHAFDAAPAERYGHPVEINKLQDTTFPDVFMYCLRGLFADDKDIQKIKQRKKYHDHLYRKTETCPIIQPDP